MLCKREAAELAGHPSKDAWWLVYGAGAAS